MIYKFSCHLISVFFKYNLQHDSVLRDITMVSTSGHRVYFKYADVFKAYAKGDVYLISTSEYGLKYTFEIILLNLKIGGEVLLKLSY